MFIVWVFRADWRIPAIGAGLMILATLVVGNVYPWAVQRFQVSPNERALEQPFIQHNIDATREADRKSTRLNSSHVAISYAFFCLKIKNIIILKMIHNIMFYIIKLSNT